MRNPDVLPRHQSMKRAHKVRRFRRGNAEHGEARASFARKIKPWTHHNPMRSAA